ncbi:gamma-secretase subunit aph-1, putative [Brugia malayi]|uniref:BMA-APH-1, isoform b n=1 Tax=Brugia malayi TaxID=6279 RepID=A0A0J9XLT3_BRUMA|nr:gamma-secretase subunit aph-1, putative [Brugia malayi]CDP90960.1 BMA-APH-1, isoform b [Brugia malayi]VIO95653.1 gamma-secretase subunit aph-1, putative [Brugia malayi]
MAVLAGIGYLFIAFSPSVVIFRRVIASDPLRIILFVLGAFFWLLSLLLSACIWFVIVPLREYLVFAVAISIALQEGARLLHFILLKKAQKGLNHMSTAGQRITGMHSLRHARHILATVCGLGMGMMAALFLIINVIADFWGHGTVGLPATVPYVSDRFTVKLLPNDQYFPITYSISACMVTLCHVFWTVIFWDGCHKKGTTNTWWMGICFAVISHYAMSALSFGNRTKYQMAVMCMQGVIVLVNAVISFLVMGVTWSLLKRRTKLAFCRMFCVKDCNSESIDTSISRSENPAEDRRSNPLHICT